MEFFALWLILWYPCYRLVLRWLRRRSRRTGAERYLAEQMKDPVYAAAYLAARERIAKVDRDVNFR